MIRALMTAASGMKAQQMQVDTIANNIANVNTNGFKKSQLSFRSLLYQTMREPGSPNGATLVNPTGLQVGSGTEISASTKIFGQGVLEPTGGMFDMALQGEGFFRIRLPNGEFRYTRDGSFQQDGTGQVVTNEGYIVETAPNIPSDSIGLVVGEDGTFSVMNSEGEAPSEIGQLSIYRFPNPTGLKAQGGNFYSETGSSGAAQQTLAAESGSGMIKQGYRERSNVQVVDELVELILAQRNYEVNSRAIRVSDEMLEQVGQLVR